jgi:hypothetical protein
MRMELDGSLTFIFMISCQTVCPLRERNQLVKTLAALGCAALLMRARPLLPADIVPGFLQVQAVQRPAYGQAFMGRALYITAADAKSELAASQPVCGLPSISGNRDIHLFQQALYKFRAEAGIVVNRRHARKPEPTRSNMAILPFHLGARRSQ